MKMNTDIPSVDTATPPPVVHSTEGGTPFVDESVFAAALERRLAEIQAVPDHELVPVNLDMHGAVTTVLGLLSEIGALRDRVRKLSELDQAVVDGLEEYALAAGEANSRYATAIAPHEDIVALNEEAIRLREILRSDATALATRGLIDPARIAQFKGLTGYKNVAFELIDWTNLLRDCWPTIRGKTALTVEEVRRAKDVAIRLVRATGQREQGPAVVAEASRLRQQALTLLMNSYDQVRRAVTFLRWNEGDADTIAPSLYAGRQRSKATAPDSPPAPGTAPAGNGSDNGGTHAAPGPALTPPAPVGMPGASPFAH
jgi:hypothetical protein